MLTELACLYGFWRRGGKLPSGSDEYKTDKLQPRITKKGENRAATRDEMDAADDAERKKMYDDVGHRFHSRIMALLEIPSLGKAKAAIPTPSAIT